MGGGGGYEVVLGGGGGGWQRGSLNKPWLKWLTFDDLNTFGHFFVLTNTTADGMKKMRHAETYSSWNDRINNKNKTVEKMKATHHDVTANVRRE